VTLACSHLSEDASEVLRVLRASNAWMTTTQIKDSAVFVVQGHAMTSALRQLERGRLIEKRTFNGLPSEFRARVIE